MQLVARLTKDILETFQICNPNFKYSEALNPKRFLTNPSVGVLNDGHDNTNSDLILHVNFVLINMESKQRFGSKTESTSLTTKFACRVLGACAYILSSFSFPIAKFFSRHVLEDAFMMSIGKMMAECKFWRWIQKGLVF